MNQLFQFAFSKIKGVKVYALVGRAGTGKSFHSKQVADKHKISLIIDDGILIKNNKIIAGHSAKEEEDFLMAVKTAVFEDDLHRNEIISALLKEKYTKILIIGTSEKMIEKITSRLNLPAASEIIRIEDISSQEEIETAMANRFSEGKHVIPAAPLEVTRTAPKIVYDSLRSFGRKKKGRINKNSEKTIVKPEFSKPKKEELSDVVLSQMVRHAISDNYPLGSVEDVKSVIDDMGEYTIKTDILLPRGHYISTTISEMQDTIVDCIEKYGGIRVKDLAIAIREF